MPTMLERVSIVNQAVRTLLLLILLGALGAGGWYGYELVGAKYRQAEALQEAEEELRLVNTALREKEQQVASLETVIDQQQAEIDRLDTAMQLLKVDHRVARVSVVEQTTDSETGQIMSDIEFQEFDDSGEPIDAAKRFRIPGDIVYIDSWVLKFDDKYVEHADLHRSTSLVLFRRIFGNHQKPSEAFELDEVGVRPGIYGRGGRMSDWEKQIWSDFWTVANDRQRQRDLGIRAAHGEAPSIRVQKGKTYRVDLRASAGLNVSPEENPPPKPSRPAA